MGTRLFIIYLIGLSEDHPHAYGDKQKRPHRLQWQLGSSPRVWGQVHRFATAGETAGIIPTRMGTRGL